LRSSWLLYWDRWLCLISYFRENTIYLNCKDWWLRDIIPVRTCSREVPVLFFGFTENQNMSTSFTEIPKYKILRKFIICELLCFSPECILKPIRFRNCFLNAPKMHSNPVPNHQGMKI
jgi:hypothetical protein